MDNINLFGVGGVAAIVIICLLIGMIVKAVGIPSKWVPCICGVCGGILGAVAFLAAPIPEFPAQDTITAVAVGIVSGLAATGAHQVVHQLTGNDYHAGYDALLAEYSKEDEGNE